MDETESLLRVGVLTVPGGMLVTHYLVKHLRVVGILLDEGIKKSRSRGVADTLRRALGVLRSQGWSGFERTLLRKLFPGLMPQAFERAVRYESRYRQRVDRLFGGHYYEHNVPSRDFVEWDEMESHYGVPVRRVDNVNSAAAAELLRSWDLDLLIIAGGRVIKQNIIDIPRIGTLNKHSSMLPRHRGLSAEYWCLYYEDFSSLGVTVHFVDAGVDTGPIVVQRRMTFEWGDTPLSLRFKSDLVGREVLVEAVRAIEASGTRGVAQDPSQATRNAAPSPATDRELYAKLPALWARYARPAQNGTQRRDVEGLACGTQGSIG
jgi:folate-dependent phosphoribosylglycinamide formyltransferase PurN